MNFIRDHVYPIIIILLLICELSQQDGLMGRFDFLEDSVLRLLKPIVMEGGN